MEETCWFCEYLELFQTPHNAYYCRKLGEYLLYSELDIVCPKKQIPKLSDAKQCRDCEHFVSGINYCRYWACEVRPKTYICEAFKLKPDAQHWKDDTL